MEWLKTILASPKKLIIDWLLKDQLAQLPKVLSGYKTTVGLLITAASCVLIYFGSDASWAEALQKGVTALLNAGFGEPLTLVEKQALVGNVVTLIGLLHKLWKWFRGQPQTPKVLKP